MKKLLPGSPLPGSAAALVFFWMIFSLTRFTPVAGALALFRPSADLFLLLFLTAVPAALDRPPRSGIRLSAAAALLLMLAFTVADTLMLHFFNRELTLHRDVGYLPALIDLISSSFGTGVLIALTGGIVAGSALLLLVLSACLRRIREGWDAILPPERQRRPIFRLIPAFASAGLFLLAGLAGGPLFAPSILPRIGEEAIRTARAEEYREEQAERLANEALRVQDKAGSGSGDGSEPRSGQSEVSTSAADAGESATPLAGLQGADVHLFFVESYGYTILSDPDKFELIREQYRTIEYRLTEAGFRAASSLMDSPAFGGNSWLADATFTTGVRIDDQTQYDLLLQSEVRPMASYFGEAGYRTVNAMPATGGEWPEGAFFGFERSYHWKDFGYRGPSFRWAPMPDQFVLDVIRRQELAKRERPLFIQYVLVSSHYPFQLIPRYLTDWNLLGDGSIFAEPGSTIRLPIPPGQQTAGPDGFIRAIRYDLEVITEYAIRFLPENSLIIMTGDHQPYSGISGQGQPPSVILHVLSRRPELIRPFLERGWVPGMVPDQPLPHPGMEIFLPALIEDFARAPS